MRIENPGRVLRNMMQARMPDFSFSDARYEGSWGVFEVTGEEKVGKYPMMIVARFEDTDLESNIVLSKRADYEAAKLATYIPIV